ncbi:hypothetical protein J5N97_029630 [Dioscorea zingiberensis]|uniref:Uncharacterized protein n=1 Tax=Dioscorea zingiberensis TaxID=325984 RepID=A0A9D5H3D9_9LILI|nr:hypothetical protein J5N97_029630 [Dioscorea zingiberensis]
MEAAGVVSAEIPKSVEGGDDLLLSRYTMLDLSTVDGFMDGSLSSSSSLISGFSDLGFLCSIVKIEAEMHAVNTLAVARMLMGSGGTVIVLAAEDISFGSLWWYLYAGISCFLVLFAGIMSGLTLGLMSLGLRSTRFYTTDFDEMEMLFNTEINKNLNQSEFEALLDEFKTDYYQTHYLVLRVPALQGAWKETQEIFSLMSRDEGRDAGVEAIGQIEELLSEVRVIEFKGDHIRLLLKTPIPSMDILPLQYNSASFIEPTVVDHELMIEVLENNLEPMNLEVNSDEVLSLFEQESRELMVKATEEQISTISKAL